MNGISFESLDQGPFTVCLLNNLVALLKSDGEILNQKMTLPIAVSIDYPY